MQNLRDRPTAIHKVATLGIDNLCIRSSTIDPFRRRLVAQDGRVINDGSRSLGMNELLHMDWLCENVEGRIPQFDELLPFAQPTVRELGIYRDSIPMEKEDAK